MESYPNWSDWKIRRTLVEGKSQSPNYAFDNWLKMTKNFGDDISSFVGQARDKDKELDDEIEKKKKEPDKKEPLDKKDDTNAGDSEAKDKETAWKKLKDIAKERMKKKEDKDSK